MSVRVVRVRVEKDIRVTRVIRIIVNRVNRDIRLTRVVIGCQGY